MTDWSNDISKAPRGRNVTAIQHREKGDVSVTRFVPDRVILATKCGKVTLSHYLPEGKERTVGRWQMLAEGEEPEAWAPWPRHPRASADDEGVMAW